MAVSKETEAKFFVRDPSVFSSLQRLASLGPFRLTHRRRERQRNIYLDTADCALKKRKAALKLRLVGRQAELTFKKELRTRQGVSERMEVTVPIRKKVVWRMSAGRLQKADSRLAPIQQVQSLIGTKPLGAILTLVTDRTRLFLAFKRQRVELDLDRVSLSRRGKEKDFHREVELENQTASPAMFREVLSTLKRHGGKRLILSSLSKYELGFKWLKQFSLLERGGLS